MKPRPHHFPRLLRRGPLYPIQCVRFVHTKNVHTASTTTSSLSEDVVPRPRPAIRRDPPPPLACLPLRNVLRTYFITSISSSPTLLGASITVLKRVVASKSAFANPEKNPLLRWPLKKTFYAQFCAGENKDEVKKTVEEMRAIGYKGVIHEYALEVLSGGDTVPEADSEQTKQEIETWRKGMLQTLSMAEAGDFIALKYAPPRSADL